MKGKIFVLIVEDDPDLALFMKLTLESHGMAACVSPDAESAFQLLPEKIPRAVILDLCLPGMDGFEFLAKIKAEKKTKDIPVIIYSTKKGAGDRRRARALGASDYLMKPFQPDAFVKKLKEVLNGQKT